jgi:hypothetical protein
MRRTLVGLGVVVVAAIVWRAFTFIQPPRVPTEPRRCVAEGTLVATPEGSVPVQGLRLGDTVLSRDAAGSARTSTVVGLRSGVATFSLRLALESGGPLVVTPTHPIALQNGWTEAGALRPGQLLETSTGLSGLVRVEGLEGPVTVYDISVEPHRTFFANGVLVHNKTPMNLRLLIETRNELAQRALDDKNYKKAIDTVQQTLTMVREENAPEEHPVVVQSKRILEDARAKKDAIGSTATEAGDACRANDLTTAALKVQQLVELDAQHPVARELSSKLNVQLKVPARDARQAMALAKDQADKISGSAPAEFQAEGRPDLGKAEEAAAEAEASLKQGGFGPALQKFSEARDAYERGRRGIETKLADAAQRDQALMALLKVPAEEARKTMELARGLAELAGAGANPAAREEFTHAITLARGAEAAMGRADYLEAKKDFDAARIAFDRSRRATAAAVRPGVPVPSPSP